jgi:hypothetical protein
MSAAKDLISLAFAKEHIQTITDNSHDTLLGDLITALSDGIEKWCRRDFTSKSYDELYSGSGDRRLILRQYPIQSIASVRYRPVTVLKIINNNTGLNQQARVQVNSVSIVLTRVSAGVTNTDVCGFGAYPTLTQLAAYITSLGNGWSAQAQGDSNDYGLWPSADLYVPPSFGDGTTSQGALTARATFAELKMHTYELAGYQFDPRGWLLRAIPYTDPELLHPEDLVFPSGINNFRVQYTAGYTTIPQAVQEACAQWVSQEYNLTTRDPAITNTVQSTTTSTLSTSAATAFSIPSLAAPPLRVQALLKPYRRCTINSSQG